MSVRNWPAEVLYGIIAECYEHDTRPELRNAEVGCI